MAGYKNRTIKHEFPDLAEDGDTISITLRNPMTVPYDALQMRPVARDANGFPLDPKDASLAAYEVYAALVVDWRVYDATEESDDQPPLPLPATPENFGKLPVEIQNWVADEVRSRQNPTKTPTTSNS